MFRTQCEKRFKSYEKSLKETKDNEEYSKLVIEIINKDVLSSQQVLRFEALEKKKKYSPKLNPPKKNTFTKRSLSFDSEDEIVKDVLECKNFATVQDRCLSVLIEAKESECTEYDFEKHCDDIEKTPFKVLKKVSSQSITLS